MVSLSKMSLKRCATILVGLGPVLGVGLDVFEVDLAPPISEAVIIYASFRDSFIAFFHLQIFFEFIAHLIDIDLSQIPHWRDVVVLLVLYTSIQIKDAKTWLARVWRGAVGVFAIVLAVFSIAFLTATLNLTSLISIVGGIFSGLLVFRILHPYQIGFDIGLRALNKADFPTGIRNKLSFIRDIYRTREAREVISKKLSAVWKLNLWMVAYLSIYSIWKFSSAGVERDDVEYLFFLVFLGFLCLFQVFMEPKTQLSGKGFGICFCSEGLVSKAYYFSTDSGNYRIGANLGYVAIWAFSLAYPTTALYSAIFEYLAN